MPYDVVVTEEVEEKLDDYRDRPSRTCSRPRSMASSMSESCSTSIVSFMPSYSCRDISTVSAGIRCIRGSNVNKSTSTGRCPQ